MNRTLLSLALMGSSTQANFCSYPMWSIPKTGTEYRCDFAECPMRPEEDCDGIYGVGQGEQCKVFCRGQRRAYEVYECVDTERWQLISKELDCQNIDPEDIGSFASLLGADAALLAFGMYTLFQI